MLNKEQVINALYDFVDEYGSPFATTYSEEMNIIEDALDMYYEKQKVNAVVVNQTANKIENIAHVDHLEI